MKKMATMCDIDGTLIKKPDDGTLDFNNTDVEYNYNTLYMLDIMKVTTDIIFFTKRHKRYEGPTRNIIEKHFKGYYRLVMRDTFEELDSTSSTKINLYFNNIREFVVLYIEDDRDTIAKFNAMGVNTVHPNDLPTKNYLNLKTDELERLFKAASLIGLTATEFIKESTVNRVDDILDVLL